MARHWEKFMGGPHISTRDRFHVTLNKKGVFQFNRKVFEAMGSPRAAVFFFEKATSVIGISSAHPQLTEAFPVNVRQGTYFTINGIPFCRSCGIELDNTEVFVNPEFDEKGILQLDLRSTRRIFVKPYKRKPKGAAK